MLFKSLLALEDFEAFDITAIKLLSIINSSYFGDDWVASA